jgi:hypothetical protein
MSENQSYPPAREDLELARLLNSRQQEAGHRESDDPLLPVLREYKSKVEFNVSSETEAGIWQAIAQAITQIK